MKCDIITHTAAIVVSQPFHVITIRMMAQFVGKETKYMYEICVFLYIILFTEIYNILEAFLDQSEKSIAKMVC